MTKDSLKKKIKEDGLAESALYYLGRFFSKVQMRVIGFLVQKFGHVCERRLVFKNREMQDFSDNARALFEYLEKNGFQEKYQIIWMVSEKKRFRDKKYKNVKFVTAENKYGWSSCRAYYYGNTAKYFFYTNNSADLNRYHCPGQITVNLWHGCGYKGAALENKNIPRSQTMAYFDYALVPGPVFVETKSKYWRCEKEKILPLGYPRYDWMLNPANDKREILSKLFGWHNKETRAIIWMPTFRKTGLTGYGENDIELPYQLPAVEGERQMEELDAFCRERKLLLIIKKHPLQSGWSSRTEDYTNIRYVTEEQFDKADVRMYALVGVCDALISDYSSIAVDYVLLGRPLGFVLTDYGLYREKRGFVFENPLDYMPGEKIYDFEGLQKFLGDVAAGRDAYAGERCRVLDRMHSRTDHYCARIVKTLGIEITIQ